MKYNFKVNINNVYKYFIEGQVDKSYIESLKKKYTEFRIKYDDTPETHNAIDFFNELEGMSDHYQILLVGINEYEEDVLCYYFVGQDYGDDDKEREQALKDFEEIKKCKI